jgi:uncharacterized protein
MGDLSHEQSMEEILSSIKRIIAEDSDAALSPPRAKRSITPLAAPAAASVPDPVAEPEVLELTEAAPAEEASVPKKPTPAAVASEKHALISDDVVAAGRSSIAALSALVVKPEVAGNDTLEGLVREMIRPMLTDWLEARLPDIVERLVAQEVRRITERGA